MFIKNRLFDKAILILKDTSLKEYQILNAAYQNILTQNYVNEINRQDDIVNLFRNNKYFCNILIHIALFDFEKDFERK